MAYKTLLKLPLVFHPHYPVPSAPEVVCQREPGCWGQPVGSQWLIPPHHLVHISNSSPVYALVSSAEGRGRIPHCSLSLVHSPSPGSCDVFIGADNTQIQVCCRCEHTPSYWGVEAGKSHAQASPRYIGHIARPCLNNNSNTSIGVMAATSDLSSWSSLLPSRACSELVSHALSLCALWVPGMNFIFCSKGNFSKIQICFKIYA